MSLLADQEPHKTESLSQVILNYLVACRAGAGPAGTDEDMRAGMLQKKSVQASMPHPRMMAEHPSRYYHGGFRHLIRGGGKKGGNHFHSTSGK